MSDPWAFIYELDGGEAGDRIEWTHQGETFTGTIDHLGGLSGRKRYVKWDDRSYIEEAPPGYRVLPDPDLSTQETPDG